jgi:putative phosphoesterase
MRIAVVSDIHGNLTALEAVIADLRSAAPEVVLLGGDLADGGARPVEVLDRVRALGWRGVLGNVDEMLFRPEALETFASQSKARAAMWEAVRANAAATRAALGEERLAWLRGLPGELRDDGFALVHARPGECWRAPGIDASEEELAEAYGPLDAAVVVYGHTHVPGVRRLGDGLVVVNAGSVGLPFDGDARASYALVDDGAAVIRRVEYDVSAELSALAACELPGAEWTAKILRARGAVMP